MKKTRHEEYSSFIDELPFSLQIGLERTLLTCSAEKNWHDNFEFQFCDEGEGEVLLDGKKYPLKKDTVVAVNSNVIHYTSTKDYLKYTCLIIDMSFCKSIGLDYTTIEFVSHIESEIIAEIFTSLKEIYLNYDNPYRKTELCAEVIKLLLELCKNHRDTSLQNVSRNCSFENVKAAIRFIRENYDRKLSLDEISKSVCTNKYTLSREFKKITGQTIVEYTNIYRCQKAAEYISDGMGVTQVAYACGFENMSFFSKMFKRYMGKNPSKYKPNKGSNKNLR